MRSGLNLPWIALEAAEHTIIQKQLPDDRIERFRQITKAVGVTGYFKEVKWIFVLDRTLYERYLTELAGSISGNLQSLIEVLNAHGNPSLVVLQDEDLVQIVFEMIYASQALKTENLQLL